VDFKCIDRRNENKKFDENKLKNHQSFVNIMKKGEKNECDDQKWRWFPWVTMTNEIQSGEMWKWHNVEMHKLFEFDWTQPLALTLVLT